MGVVQRRFHIVVFQLYDCTIDLNLVSGDENQTDEMIGCCCCCFCCRFPVLPAPLRVFWQWCTQGRSDNRRCRCRRRPALCPRCLRQNIQRNVNGRTKTELEMHSTETQHKWATISDNKVISRRNWLWNYDPVWLVIGAGSLVVEVATALPGQAQQWVSEWLWPWPLTFRPQTQRTNT